MRIFFVFVTLLSLQFLAGCSERLSHQSHNPFVVKKEKVLLYKTEKPKGWKRFFQSDLLGNSEIIAAGTELSVLVNETCLTNNVTQSILGFRETQLSESLSKRSLEQTHRVELKKDLTIKELKTIASGDRCLIGISHNRKAYTASHFNDPMNSQQKYLDDIRTESSYNFFKRPVELNSVLTIAVVDTGLDLTHPDLQNSLWVNTREANGIPNTDDDNNGYVDDVHGYNFASRIGDVSHQTFNDHGTHVAGLAAAAANNGVGITGVMGHGLKVMALNVFGKQLGTDTIDIDEAIRYAADNGADVINISVGGPGESETTAAAVQYAIQKGAVIVASSGNLKQNISEEIYYPASYAKRYAGMLAVGATISGTNQICDFSNFSNDSVKVLAPGCDLNAPKSGLLSTKANGKYGHMKGTSMAAPIVSASIAMTLGYLIDHSTTKPLPEVTEDYFLNGCKQDVSLSQYAKDGCLLNLDSLSESLKESIRK